MATFAVSSRTKTKEKYGTKKGCANPLFEQWLIEWRDEAKEKGHPNHYGYDKALKSLRQFPLPLKNGAEATQLLKFWGDKLAKMIDVRVTKYEEETGLKVNDGISALEPLQNRQPLPLGVATGVATGNNKTLEQGSAAQKVPARRKKTPPSNVVRGDPDVVAVDNAYVDAAPAPKRKRTVQNQEYVPQRGSGPYSILLALLKASQHPNYPGHMSKADLQHEAQMFSNKSMTQADPGSYYTGWSSASTLINKGLMTKKGCPARYTLTENGEALAERLEVVETGRPLGGGSGANSNSCGSSGTVMSPPLPNFSSAGSSLTSLNSLPGALTSPITKRKESTPKQSTSPTLSPREMAAQAAIRRNQAVQSGSRAADLEQWKEFPACAATNRSASSNQMKSRSACATAASVTPTFITLSDEEEDAQARAELLASKSSLSRYSLSPKEHDLAFTGGSPLASLCGARNGHEASGYGSDEGLPVVSAVTTTQSRAPQGTGMKKVSSAASLNTERPQLSASTSSGVPSASGYQPTAISRPVPSAAPGVSSSTAVEPLSEPALTFPVGTYEIVLLCDTCERREGYTGQILEELERNHIRFERRKLNIGDYVWIAQQHAQPIPGQLRRPPPREMVLDYIIERKRMDDLAASIIGSKDRYREQKFRIAQSGLAHPIYLVEDFSKSNHVIGEDALFQAMATTQVQDGYFVKHTSSARESASYLTLVSRRLSQMYSRTSVRSCTRDELSRRPLLANGITHHTRLLQFNDFNELAIKNKVMSVTELFARQLMQLTGISAARASSVLELYPTPRLLMEAYDNAGSESEKLGLLSNVTAGSAKRRFNSAPLYHMYAVRDTAS